MLCNSPRTKQKEVTQQAPLMTYYAMQKLQKENY